MPENDKANVVMSWEVILTLVEQAKASAAEHDTEAVVMMGLGAWTLAREVFEERLREPLVADCVVVDGIELRPSFHCDPPQILLMPRDATRRVIPLVIQPLENDLNIEA
jgi:hypothetical protein